MYIVVLCVCAQGEDDDELEELLGDEAQAELDALAATKDVLGDEAEEGAGVGGDEDEGGFKALRARLAAKQVGFMGGLRAPNPVEGVAGRRRRGCGVACFSRTGSQLDAVFGHQLACCILARPVTLHSLGAWASQMPSKQQCTLLLKCAPFFAMRLAADTRPT